jgi:hypothetical protein
LWGPQQEWISYGVKVPRARSRQVIVLLSTLT